MVQQRNRTTRLTPRQLGELAEAALANALELRLDSLTLAEAQRRNTAHALAVLAWEELGKHLHCFESFIYMSDSDEDWKTFWRRFYGHEAKSQTCSAIISQFLVVDEAALTRIGHESQAEYFHKSKMRALYVDYSSGTVVPSEVSERDFNGGQRLLTSVEGWYKDVARNLGSLPDIFDRLGWRPPPRLGLELGGWIRDENMRPFTRKVQFRPPPT